MSLQDNTTELQSILAAVNALPDATPTVLGAVTITPTTEQQSITPPDGIDGYNSVNVEAVTAAIDPNIQPENIKKDEVILGVVGTHQGGTAPVEEKDICLFDYDGTLLYSYTIAELQALTELPIPPEHDNLVFNGWNWTLEELKALNGPMDVGAYYDTVDGAVYLYVEIEDPEKQPITMSAQTYGYAVDWGDGTQSERATSHSHTYSAPGKYKIRLSWSDGFYFGAFCKDNYASRQTLTRAEIGKDCERVWSGGFDNCHKLTVLAHSGATSFYDTSFYDTSLPIFIFERETIGNQVVRRVPLARLIFNLANTKCGNYLHDGSVTKINRVCLPPTFTTYGTNFMGGTRVGKINIPEAATSLEIGFCRNCDALQTITIPASVTNIADYAFYSCEALREIHFMSPTPPTVAGANAFNAGFADRIIYVPVGSLEAYQNATNLAQYAAQMQEEPT